MVEGAVDTFRTKKAEAPSAEPVVAFEHVSLAFDDKVILKDVSFALTQGNTKIILGASGAGKSITLKIIMGLLKSIEQFIELSGPNTKVVPGHGPVTNRAALVAHRDLIVTVRDRVSAAIKEGKTLEQIQAARPTQEFEQRVGGLPQFIPNFVTALYNALSAPAR